MAEHDDNFLYGKPIAEIDEPIDGHKDNVDEDLTTAKLQEKDKERKEKRYFSAFKLFVGCLVFLGIVYLFDVIASALLQGELSSITGSVVEVIKTLLFTLSGYLFARKENGD